MADDGWLVVGLGNPGPTYAGNRHNAGYLVVELLAERMSASFKSHKGTRGLADVVEGRLGGVPGHRVVLARPRTYMNESGGPVAALRDYYDVPPERIIAVHDELDIPYGALRLKLGGGDNGHNGLKSMRKSLGTGEFLRVRFGIGRPPGRMDPAAFVLKDFSPAERKELDFLVDRAADSVEALICDGLERAQNQYNL
jgi:PTH1 family peptidyl-tRNA hydrolase